MLSIQDTLGIQPKTVISTNLKKHGVLVGIHGNSDICKTEPDKCEELKGRFQELMNQGVLQFLRSKAVEEVFSIEPIEIVYQKKNIKAPMKKIQPFNIHVPALFPYQDFKVVPWKYDAPIYLDGKRSNFMILKFST